MKMCQWVPKADAALRSREDYRKLDQRMHDTVDEMRKILRREQKIVVMEYMDAVQMSAMLRMMEAYKLGVEQGRQEI